MKDSNQQKSNDFLFIIVIVLLLVVLIAASVWFLTRYKGTRRAKLGSDGGSFKVVVPEI